MPKKQQLISFIEIKFNDGITTDQLSEGEKKLILVKTVLEIISDENTLLLFDEPDANLHEGRKNALYNMMIEYPNRQIVLATHSPTFIDIAEQEQIKLIKNDADGKSYIYATDKVEAIRQLTGSRFNAYLEKPILFCEGTSTSVEADLYPVLFPNYKVILSGGHDEVIRNVEGYNAVLGDEMHRAIGIIDWDYMDDARVNALKNKQIYSIHVVEIENVLMNLSLLNYAKDQFCADDDSVDKVKQKLYDDCSRYKGNQAIKYTKSRIVSNIKTQVSAEGRTIDDFKSNISRICDIGNIDELYGEQLSSLEHMINESKYSELVSVYDFNHNIDRFVKDITNDYLKKIIRLIRKTPELQELIRRQYYSEIPEV